MKKEMYRVYDFHSCRILHHATEFWNAAEYCAIALSAANSSRKMHQQNASDLTRCKTPQLQDRQECGKVQDCINY